MSAAPSSGGGPAGAPGEAPRQGVHGVDVFAIAGQSISGFVYSYKSPSGAGVKQAYTTTREQYLALYLEYHPLVRWYQRGDATEECARRYALPTPLGTPYPVPYSWDGEERVYLPDFVVTLSNGGVCLAEAGALKHLRRGEARAKAEAARHYARQRGGDFWISTGTTSTDPLTCATLYDNLVFLNARRDEFATYAAICDAFARRWPPGRLRTPRELIAELAPQWSAREVEGAIWKRAADAASTGHLLFDLAHQRLTLDALLALQDPTWDPVLLPPLPSQLDGDDAEDDLPARVRDRAVLLPEDAEADGTRAHDSVGVDDELGGSIDPTAIASEPERERFERLRNAVYAVADGKGVRETARAYAMDHMHLARLLARWREVGDLALLSHRLHHGTPRLHPDVLACITKLYTSRQQLTNRQIQEHPTLKREVDRLSAQGVAVRLPSYRQICLMVARLERETTPGRRSPRDRREGARRLPRERQSAYSYVLSHRYPAGECQVDEHYLDVRVVTRDNEQVTMRVYAAVLICVSTSAILSFVLSPHSLTENDYMRLIKQAIEPKDRLTALYDCQNEWPCSAKPMKILYDRGKIFTSKRATAVLVDRLHVLQEKAPAWAPSAKGTVEALFQWVMHEFTHRLPGTTKGSVQARGGYDADAEAIKAGVTFDVLEMYFTRAIVDDYMRDYDTLRRQRRFRLWNDAVAETGVARYLGSRDDLKLLLMRANNPKNPASGAYLVHPMKGVSFQGRWYVNPEVVPRLRGDQVTIYYDPRDITIIYLYHTGVYMGPVFCTTLMGRVSIWEAKAMRAYDRTEHALASAETIDARRANIAAASAGKAAQKREARELERKRALDQQRSEIHPEAVLALAEAIDDSRRSQGLPRQFVGDGHSASPGLPASASGSTSPTSRVAPPRPDDTVVPLRKLVSRPRLRPVVPTDSTESSLPLVRSEAPEAPPERLSWNSDTVRDPEVRDESAETDDVDG